MSESDVIEFFERYAITKALDGLAGKDITAWFEAFKNGAKERFENLSAILERRRKKAEEQGKEVSFNISPRIAERIANEGSYSSEAVMQDYYAGILLSTQDDPLNDAGVFYLSTIHRLSSLQLRAHYVLYQMFKEAYSSYGNARGLLNTDPSTGLTYVGANEFLRALYGEEKVDESQSTDDQYDQFVEHVDHILQGLKKENLIKSFFTMIESEETSPNYSSYFAFNQEMGQTKSNRRLYYFFTPTVEGAQLFMWGQGFGKLSTRDFLRDEIANMPPLYNIEIPDAKPYSSNNDLFKHTLVHEIAQRKFDN